jgi:hypothetical protein
MNNFGLSAAGFNKQTLTDSKTALENAFIAEFGDINLDPQSVFGQQIGVLAKSFSDFWDNLEDVYYSQYPDSAEGTSLEWNRKNPSAANRSHCFLRRY